MAYPVWLSRSRLRGILLLAGLSLSMQVVAADDVLLISGGPIHTGVAERPQVEALLVRDGRIVFAGDLQEAKAQGSDAVHVDLGGNFAYPGFVDAHAHLASIGLSTLVLDLVGTGSVKELQERLRAWSTEHLEGPIEGRGWIETHWPEKRFPTRADLDAVVPDRPVYLVRADGHAAVANSAALALAGIDRATQDPDGGLIERDASGEATGMLIDTAQGLVGAKLPEPTLQQRREAIHAAAELYASRGWTGLADMAMDWQDVALVEELASRGELPIRVDGFLRQSDAEQVIATGTTEDASGLFHLRGIKLFMDGALGSRGAALFAPYADQPHNTGLLLISEQELEDLLPRAREAGVQIVVHAIGDRGNRLVLDAFEQTYADAPAALADARWRVEHAQVLSREDIPRFAGLGVIASMQPSHAIGDLHFAPARLGPDRLEGAYAWRSLLDSGAVIAAGSDAPVEKGDPLIEFYAAFHRHDLDGYAGADWHPGEAVTREEALRMLTWGPAYGVGREDQQGTLEVGKRADLSVFSVDLMNAEPRQIPSGHAVMTIVDGKVVYRGGN